jgi:deoxyribonuclease (pyrimidine dimer)
MTRVNANISPKELHRLHLIAEYREITMVPASLRRSLRTKSTESILKSIPNSFTLNRGHVTFFYDKMLYLKKRFFSLCEEMENRGYRYDVSRGEVFDGFDSVFMGDWGPSESDNDVVRERISLRIQQKPHLYALKNDNKTLGNN